MTVLARIICCIAAMVLLAACGADSHKTTNTTTTTDTVARQSPVAQKIVRARNQLTDTLLASIINYYHKNYADDTIQMNTERSDTLLELTFSNITKDTADYNGTLMMADISLVTDINPIITGDMNGDGINDMLVTVHTEGGGLGGNAWWDDHFLFLGQGGGYRLADVKSDGEIMDGSGHFFPVEIADQTIKGIGNGYADTDGYCCPSLYYSISVRLKSGHMATSKKLAIPKPADF